MRYVQCKKIGKPNNFKIFRSNITKDSKQDYSQNQILCMLQIAMYLFFLCIQALIYGINLPIFLTGHLFVGIDWCSTNQNVERIKNCLKERNSELILVTGGNAACIICLIIFMLCQKPILSHEAFIFCLKFVPKRYKIHL
jgi:hypothetical protein